MKVRKYLMACCFLFISACDTGTTPNTTKGKEAAGLPSDAPALGATIKQRPNPSKVSPSPINEYTEITWKDLELPGFGAEDVVKKYLDRIEATPEGDPAEESIMKKMLAELNTVPINPDMNGKKIKLPGFISPLELNEGKGMVGDFLLVPYFGACIHLPPPPLSQTILVTPQKDKSIGMEQIYEPVWVTGTITTEKAKTELGEAGYQIVDASVEIYREPGDEAR